jgi:hypothetical protein
MPGRGSNLGRPDTQQKTRIRDTPALAIPEHGRTGPRTGGPFPHRRPATGRSQADCRSGAGLDWDWQRPRVVPVGGRWSPEVELKAGRVLTNVATGLL